MNLDRLLADIKDARAGEGFRGTVYPDPRGILTIGYGRNLQGNGISPAEAEVLLRNDITRLQGEIGTRLQWTAALDDVRYRVFIEVGYISGVRGLLTFHKMLAASAAAVSGAGEWVTAHAELLDSDWAKQVQPARRDRLASMLLTGMEL